MGGGEWPKGTADQYIFAGGLQIGGVIDPTQSKSVNGFAGDTAGAFFYNTAAGTGNANGGAVTISGGAAVGTGSQGLVNLSTTAFSSASVQTFASSGVFAITAGRES